MEMVSFAAQLLYPFGRLDVPLGQLLCCVQEKILLLLLGIEPSCPQSFSQWAITIMIYSIFWLPFCFNSDLIVKQKANKI
jgi:hypothetical protein